MRGGKTKTDKSKEIIYRLSHIDDFNKAVKEGKKKYLTRDYGNPQYIFWREQLLQDYGYFPTNRLRKLFDSYLNTGKIEKNSTENDTYIPIEYLSDEEIEKTNRGFIKIRLYDGVSRDDFIDYIKDNWNMLMKLIKLEGKPKVKRINAVINKNKIDLILSLNKLSTDKLSKKLNNPKEKLSRDLLIARILKEQNFPNTSPESINKIISQYGKQKPNQA